MGDAQRDGHDLAWYSKGGELMKEMFPGAQLSRAGDVRS
jgi:hypothetical protein